MPLNKYAPQVANHRRTQVAILEGTKSLIATVGLKKMSMIEIADIAQVSRATLYNHYRDKSAVISALITAEVEFMIDLANKAGTPADALEKLSLYISTDGALSSMRIHDKEALTEMLSHAEHPLYVELAKCLFLATKSAAGTGVAMRWLMGQALQPLNPGQSREQAELLVDRTLF
jgi:AcrR family transcriptional regulator